MPPPTVPALPFALRAKQDAHPGAPVKPRPKRTTEEVQQEKAVHYNPENGAIDPISDGPRSSDEFVPPAEPGDPDDEELEPSEDKGQVTKPGHKKKPPKGAARKAVEEQREKLLGVTSAAKGKRKEPPTSKQAILLTGLSRAAKKSKAPTKATIGGLHEEWKRGRAPSSSCAASERSKSAGSAMSVDAFSNGDAAAVPPLIQVQVQQIAESERKVQFGVRAGGIFAERVRTPNLKRQDGNTFQQIYPHSGIIYVGILAPHYDPMSLFVPDVEWGQTFEVWQFAEPDLSNDSSEGIGGFSSNVDDGNEVAWASSHNDEKVGHKLGNSSKIDSLAGVIETDAPGLVPLHRSKPGIKKAGITLGDLPREIRTLFHTKFKTRLIQDIGSDGKVRFNLSVGNFSGSAFGKKHPEPEPNRTFSSLDVGTLPTWHDLDNWEDLADIWDDVFPAHALAENQDLQIVVQKLAEDKLNSWRHKFAAAAVEALSSCFNLWKLETAEERTETVKWLLEGTENSCVFYYQSYHDKLDDGAAEDAVPTVNPKPFMDPMRMHNMILLTPIPLWGIGVFYSSGQTGPQLLQDGETCYPPTALGMSALVALVNQLTTKQWTTIIAIWIEKAVDIQLSTPLVFGRKL
ncbi:hypothetical protein B0H10DRAFT_1969395 [Mycena sp. CBHHK59/15]|nr:hypothetical protein B0H10DRAFT_1969395 [Mycena sp. CBHHK59/15]